MGCLSFTPSLLPRGGVVQGLIWGITAAIGYGLGVLFAWIWRAFADREPRRPRHRSWLVFFISAAVLVVVSFGLGQYWQYQIRKLMAVTDYSIPLVIASPFVAAAVFCLLLLIGRGLRGLYRWAAQLLSRRIGRRAARATGWTLVAGLAYLDVGWRAAPSPAPGPTPGLSALQRPLATDPIRVYAGLDSADSLQGEVDLRSGTCSARAVSGARTCW